MTVAVKAEPEGRGASLAVHRLPHGAALPVTGPRNNFQLHHDDRPVVLLAGGIGVTPVYAMATGLRCAGRPFATAYYVRERAFAAFDGHLRALDLGQRFRLHCDDEEGLRRC